MKRFLIILVVSLFFAFNDCTRKQDKPLSKQEKAEIAVKKYLNVPLGSDSAKRMRFSKLESDWRQNVIALLNGYKMPISIGTHVYYKYKPVYFTLNSSLDHVEGSFTQ